MTKSSSANLHVTAGVDTGASRSPCVFGGMLVAEDCGAAAVDVGYGSQCIL